MSEYVYFIQSQYSGHIKIGFTRNLWTRLAAIQAHSGDIINLLIHVSGENMRPHEQALHRHFKDERLHGEWFSPSPRLLEAVAKLRANKDQDWLKWYDGMQKIYINDPEDIREECYADA